MRNVQQFTPADIRKAHRDALNSLPLLREFIEWLSLPDNRTRVETTLSDSIAQGGIESAPELAANKIAALIDVLDNFTVGNLVLHANQLHTVYGVVIAEGIAPQTINARTMSGACLALRILQIAARTNDVATADTIGPWLESVATAADSD